MSQWILGGLAFFVASTVQACTGFGFALVAVPLLLLALPQATVVPVCALLSMFVSIAAVLECRRHLRARLVFPLLLGGVAGVPFGTKLLLTVAEGPFKLAVGVFVFLLALILMRGWTRPIRNQKIALLPVGLASGILNGSIALSGPPAILFLSNQQTPKDVFRANLMGYFILLNVWTVGFFAARGLIDRAVMLRVGIYVPVVILGALLGIRLSRVLSEPVFRKVALAIVAVTGLILVAKSLW